MKNGLAYQPVINIEQYEDYRYGAPNTTAYRKEVLGMLRIKDPETPAWLGLK